MKYRSSALVVCIAIAVLGVVASAKPEEQQERIDASFLLAQGRCPTREERQIWTEPTERSFKELMDRQRDDLRKDASVRRAVASRATADAYGTEALPPELVSTSGEGTYSEQVQRHLEWLSTHPETYRQLVDRAYRHVVGREAYTIEQEYWRERKPLSYVMLVGCIDSWARRNAPGLMATTGTASISINCVHLVTRRLSPSVAAEVRAGSGFAPDGDAALALACDRDVIAPGASQIVSIGGIHLIAVGSSAF